MKFKYIFYLVLLIMMHYEVGRLLNGIDTLKANDPSSDSSEVKFSSSYSLFKYSPSHKLKSAGAIRGQKTMFRFKKLKNKNQM
ncbi:hypothetical protein ACFGVR_10945 [Mucilaginibacter sp. AW1-3]